MTQSVVYSIVFYDADDKHHHTDKNIMFCNSEKYLKEILALYGQVQVTVCVCCQNKRDVLNELQQCPNVASIFVCTRDHPDHNEQNWSTNHRPVIRQHLFEDRYQWQIAAHADALKANDKIDVTNYIQQILQELVEKELCTPRITSEEETNPAPLN